MEIPILGGHPAPPPPKLSRGNKKVKSLYQFSVSPTVFSEKASHNQFSSGITENKLKKFQRKKKETKLTKWKFIEEKIKYLYGFF